MPQHLGWQTLLYADAQELKDVYDNILDQLGKRSGALVRIFHNAQNKIRNAATLKRLVVDLIDKQNWSATKVDIKGDAYEALLEKGAEEVKSGAGQYFTPRALIQAMVECMQPTALDTIIDPACGTGGFLLAAYEHIIMDREDEECPPRRRSMGPVAGSAELSWWRTPHGWRR